MNAPAAAVSYISSGRLLLIGPAERVAAAWARLPAPLSRFALLSDAPGGLPQERCLTGARAIAVEGWLGAFHVTARLQEGVCAVHERLTGTGGAFDLILDLSPAPLLSLPVPPVGYYAPGVDEERLARMLTELPDMIGVFDKPKFFSYRAELCAHDSGAVRGCRACLERCGAAAIAAENGGVRVNPYLCQGCGDCTSACPSGALRYACPTPAESLQSLRRMLQDFTCANRNTPWLLLLPGEEGEVWWETRAETLPDRLLPFPLEALGAAGLEFWLAALAFGAAGVALLDLPHVSDMTRANLEQQLNHGRALLDALGIGGERLVFSATPALPEKTALCPPATFACLHDKRKTLHLALEHLWRHAPLQPEEAALPEGAPFGAIHVDAEKCTLCLACVTLCPTGALLDGGEEPRLSLIEVNCVQCGRCAHGCPESAIALEPRYLFDHNRARAPRLVHQEAVFHCEGCGKPFATERMIRAISERLKNHPMFQGGRLRSLRLCEECRVREMFPDGWFERKTAQT
jgi:ferredoxin